VSCYVVNTVDAPTRTNYNKAKLLYVMKFSATVLRDTGWVIQFWGLLLHKFFSMKQCLAYQSCIVY